MLHICDFGTMFCYGGKVWRPELQPRLCVLMGCMTLGKSFSLYNWCPRLKIQTRLFVGFFFFFFFNPPLWSTWMSMVACFDFVRLTLAGDLHILLYPYRASSYHIILTFFLPLPLQCTGVSSNTSNSPLYYLLLAQCLSSCPVKVG